MKNKENLEEKLEGYMKEEEEENLIIGGDFNIIIGELGGMDMEGEDMERYNKDKIGNRGRSFVGKR